MEPTQPLTARAALDAAVRALSETSPSPSVDADVLLRHATGLTRTAVVAQPKHVLSDAAYVEFAALVERRRRGEPVAYLTGRREFWSLDLAVTPATLIPRPETERLVECALRRIPSTPAPTIVDLGTGCGAIALAMARECRHARIVATDDSEAALAVARANASRLNVANVEFLPGDWLAPLHERRFDVIVSNPPYVRENDPHLNQGDLPFEPRAALVAGGDGLDVIRRIADAAAAHLVRGGWLLLEHGYDQAADVRAYLMRAGYREVRSYRDLAGRERVTEGRVS